MSNDVIITGRLFRVFPVNTYPSGFRKREFVVETEEQYPQQLKVELVQDKADLLVEEHQGQRVEVHVNLRGDFYKDRWYVNVRAWRLRVLAEDTSGYETEDPPEEEPYHESY